eukprot:6176837-Pleurochrysis_carterae.AAC.3
MPRSARPTTQGALPSRPVSLLNPSARPFVAPMSPICNAIADGGWVEHFGRRRARWRRHRACVRSAVRSYVPSAVVRYA